MANLATKYLNLDLRNPIIVSSSGLTDSVEKIKKLEEYGAGAVVLKSLFEEQISYEANRVIDATASSYPEVDDYVKFYTRSSAVDQYLQLIEDAKKQVKIPIIASINCLTANDWIEFAKKIEIAGADALELNMFFFPNDKDFRSNDYEKIYSDLVVRTKALIKIPISIKLGCNFTNLLNITDQLYFRGASGIVLFNRFYETDIDVETLEFKPSNIFSQPEDISNTLRWTGIVSGQIEHLDIAASTGIHNGFDVAKVLLAGAKTAMVCSTLYKNGPQHLIEMLKQFESWMDKKGYKSIDEFRGKLNYKHIANPKIFERTQFIRYFSSIH